MEENFNIEAEKIINEHRKYFHEGLTRDLDFRIKQLNKLKEAIMKNEKFITEALYKDLHKSEFEAYATEIGFLLDSIRYMSKNLKAWAKVKKVKTPISQFGAKSYIYSEPYGTVLIIGPFNYPFQLVIEPMIGAIAAGNTVVLKPSEFTPNISKLVSKIIKEIFDEKYIRVIEGGKEVTSALIHAPFDYIFFTGSVGVGKIVMEAASKNLVPLTLELGGKSPAIVDKEANIQVAAERIAWGKFLNAAQTCVAPDYVYVHKTVKEEFLKRIKIVIKDFYGENPIESKAYGRIVNEKQFDRLISLIDENKIYTGGNYNKEELYVEPTIMEDVTWEDKVMEDEIFGPILPILEFEDTMEIIEVINSHQKPLALYIFSENKRVQDEFINRVSYGGGCVNDTISHLATPHLPFGGVGSSGIGGYHGKHSFETFSHKKSMMKKSSKFSVKFIYPPYNDKKIALVKRFLK